jgi:hypothetical protein
MIFNLIISMFVMLFGLVYKWLEQNVINYVLNFVKGFEQALVMFTVIIFLLITIYIIVKHVKRMPKSYVIEIVDVFGNRVLVDGMRHIFSRFDVAKSYAQYYNDLYGKQYKFRVSGRNRILDPFNKKLSGPINDKASIISSHDDE